MIGWSCTQVLVPLCFSFSEAAIHAWPKVLYVTVFAPHLSRRVNLLHCMAYPLYIRHWADCSGPVVDVWQEFWINLWPLAVASQESRPLRRLSSARSPSLCAPSEWTRMSDCTWPKHLHVYVSMWNETKQNKTTKRTLTQMSTTNTRETLDCRSFNSVVVPDDFIQTELGYEVEHGVLSRDGKRYCCFVCFLENVVLSLHWNWRLWKEVPGLLELSLIDETRAEQVTTQAS